MRARAYVSREPPSMNNPLRSSHAVSATATTGASARLHTQGRWRRDATRSCTCRFSATTASSACPARAASSARTPTTCLSTGCIPPGARRARCRAAISPCPNLAARAPCGRLRGLCLLGACRGAAALIVWAGSLKWPAPSVARGRRCRACLHAPAVAHSNCCAWMHACRQAGSDSHTHHFLRMHVCMP
jgi:hypothetical protein